METVTKTLNYNAIADGISEWLKTYAQKSGAKGFVMGVSGGIDSAVVSALCARTGLDLLVLEMPIHQGQDQVDRAANHIAWLKSKYPNVSSKRIDLTSTYDSLYEAYAPEAGSTSKESFDFCMANTRSRLRMVTLYQFAGINKYLVAGTGNKVEDFGIGFYTKYGDGGVDISPIGDLMKSEVYALGAALGVGNDILTAAPTDGLHADGRTDEDQIGATYDELEWAMKLVNGTPYDKFYANPTERQNKVLEIYNKFHNGNKHKMDPIPVFDTTQYRA
ncbi:MAG: NAD(+) synthase [Nanoarchaeota archaeon]